MIEWLCALEFWRVPWGERMLQASYQGAVVLAVAWAIARWCPFLSPRVICWVWRLACLKLVVTLLCVPPIGVPLLPAKPETTARAEASRLHAATAQNAPQKPPSLEHPLFVGQNDRQPGAVVNHSSVFPWWQLLWLAGVCGSVAITLGRWKFVRRLCREAQPSQRAVLQQLLQLEAEGLRIHRMPELRCSAQADGPLLAGIGRPKIVLPDRVEESLDEAELRLVLAHELAHLKRRDLLWNWLPTIVGWLFWFHPLVWLMKRSWTEAQEAACDELLIQNRGARPAEYGRLLLKLALRWQQRSGPPLVAAHMFGPSHNLERRILTMARVRAFSRYRLMTAALMLSLVAVPGIIPWRLVAQEPSRGAEQSAKSRRSAVPAPPTGKAHPDDRLAQAQSFTGSISNDGTSTAFSGTLSNSVAGQMPGKIYTWASLDLKTPTGANETFRGPIAIDPNTGKWEKLGIDGASIRVSPREDWLAFCRYRVSDAKHTESEPFFSDLKGGPPVRIAESGLGQIWSPDGKRLLYHISNKTKSSEDLGFRGTAWIYDVATKHATKAPLPVTDEADDWSLTGDWLVTVSDRHPPFGHGYQLYVMHPDGTEQRRLTEGDGLNCYPRFQPATNRVAYHHQGHGSDSLWLVDFDGSNRKQLLVSDNEGRGAPNGAAWSPDGKWLAVATFDWESKFVGSGKTKKREFFRGAGFANDRLEIIAPDGSSKGVLKLDHVVRVDFLAQPDWR
jgi:beta-lactamase regulating signal transducer with metallopeptidase domain